MNRYKLKQQQMRETKLTSFVLERTPTFKTFITELLKQTFLNTNRTEPG